MKRLKDARDRPPPQGIPPELIERCKQGDERAWNELVGATYRDVYTLCLRILRDPNDAAEATQEAYVKVWKGLKAFRGDAALETWMYRVASNAAISKHRSRRRRQAHEAGVGDGMLTEMAASGSVEEAAGAKVEVQALDKALRSLPEHYRSAVVLRDVYGFSTEEIAKQLKISETAAKVRVHRGRKKLKEMLYGSNDG
ncbi:MAG TPA: RNA polymerase sigma factor [Actinomycetota bacterium]|nr:RNA polymerase sigma factor [Actinomycetota bacterium]